MKLAIWFLGVCSISFLVGCGNGTEVPSRPSASTDEGGDTVASVVSPSGTHSSSPALGSPVAVDAAPEEVVVAFLDALRKGNDDHASALLTDRARSDTLNEGFVVSPPGTPSAKYEISSARFVSELKDRAHVDCNWRETGLDDYTEEFKVVWLLRKQPDIGWRIYGMQGEGPDGPRTVYNFENARDMKIKLAIDTEPATGEIRQARVGDSPTGL